MVGGTFNNHEPRAIPHQGQIRISQSGTQTSVYFSCPSDSSVVQPSLRNHALTEKLALMEKKKSKLYIRKLCNLGLASDNSGA